MQEKEEIIQEIATDAEPVDQMQAEEDIDTVEPTAEASEEAMEEVELTDEERIKQEKEQAHARSVQMRKKILPIIAIVLGVMILVPVILTLILQRFDKEPEYELVGLPNYTFVAPYDGDILQAPEYLRLYREIGYYDNSFGHGSMQVVTENVANPHLQFIYRYLQSIIRGDADTYNTFFSDTYFKTNPRKAPFAQQMVYDTTICFYSSEADESGGMLYTYKINYKIHQNNGTFRRDIGSDISRPQYMVLRQNSDGSVAIERLMIERIAVQK